MSKSEFFPLTDVPQPSMHIGEEAARTGYKYATEISPLHDLADIVEVSKWCAWCSHRNIYRVTVRQEIENRTAMDNYKCEDCGHGLEKAARLSREREERQQIEFRRLHPDWDL